MSAIEELIQQGVKLAKAGNKREAKEIFVQVVKQEPKNVRAWYFLSQVVDSREQSIYCLEKILQIQPENLQIAELLQKLKLQTPPTPPVSAASTPATQPTPSLPPEPVIVIKEKKQNKLITFLAAFSLVVIICICVSVAISGGGGTGSFSKAHEVILRVSGSTDSAFITYTNAQGGTEQVEVYLPWEKRFSIKESTFLYVSAQNQRDYGYITCEILLDEKVIKNSTSSGAYVIASCDHWYYP